MTTNISFTIPSELLRKIDNDRGDVPRSRFIMRLLEKAFKSESISLNNENTMPVDQSFEAKDQQTMTIRQDIQDE